MIEVIKKVEYGSTFYYIKGTSMLHREDGPAMIYDNGDKYWYVNGKRHREDGPAVEFHTGSESWYCNGKLHREDGPAQDWGDKKRTRLWNNIGFQGDRCPGKGLCPNMGGNKHKSTAQQGKNKCKDGLYGNTFSVNKLHRIPMALCSAIESACKNTFIP